MATNVSNAVSQAATNEAADLAKLKQNMPPLQHARGARWPIVFWNPAPQAPEMMRAWVLRGVIPLSVAGPGDPSIRPFLHFLQEHDVPVIFLVQGLVQHAFSKNGQKFGDADSPAWLLENPANATQRAAALAMAKSLQADGIIPTSIWIDFEAGAYLRNQNDQEEKVRALQEKALNNPADVTRFGKEQLSSLEGFQRAVDESRAQVMRENFSDPVHSIFPNAQLGNFFAWPIQRAIAKNPARYANRYPAYGYENSGLTVMQPRCYYTVSWGSGPKASQEEINWNVFQYSLDRFSRAASVKKAGEKLVPWIGYLIADDGSGGAEASRKKAALGGVLASPEAYREMVIHTMMRGAETLAVYAPSTLSETLTKEYPPDFARRELGPLLLNLVDVQSGYDDVLRFNSILRESAILNFDVPAKENPGAFWSGLQTKEKAVIRTVNFGEETTQAISVFGKQIELPFKKHGQYFWIFPDGKIVPIND
jgi:hypothetical protein